MKKTLERIPHSASAACSTLSAPPLLEVSPLLQLLLNTLSHALLFLFQHSDSDDVPDESVHLNPTDTGMPLTDAQPPSPPPADVIVETTFFEPSEKLMIDPNLFADALKNTKKARKSRKLRSYYKKQQELVDAYQNLGQLRDHSFPTLKQHMDEQAQQKDNTLIPKLAFAMNTVILAGKIAAVALSSDSTAIISSLIDSAIDFVSSIMVWYTLRKMQKRSPQKYPQGRARLEPICIVVLSAIMGSASFQVIVQSAEKIVKDAPLEELVIPTIVIMVVTVVTKFIFYFVCKRHKSESIKALADDQRNDCFSNTLALLCGFIGGRYWKYLDPIGAIAISLYIAIGWLAKGLSQISLLSGRSASPAILNQLTYVCLNHANILRVDTVRGYHVGYNLMVEVHVMMPGDMSLREAHDIGESLQRKLERMDIVERAFVHLDYETDHKANDEHKVL